MFNTSALKASALAAAFFSASAFALPPTTVSWVQQNGTASQTDTIEIWVRLAVDASASAPLVLDGTTTSFDPAELSEFSTVDYVFNAGWATCATNFFPPGCFDPASPWLFAFNYDSATSFFASPPLTLNPGESHDFLFGTFTPQNGPVAPGVYSFTSAALILIVQGLDMAGAPLQLDFTLGETCPTGESSCYFNREILAVPEPSTYALFALGLAGLVATARRSKLG